MFELYNQPKIHRFIVMFPFLRIFHIIHWSFAMLQSHLLVQSQVVSMSPIDQQTSMKLGAISDSPARLAAFQDLLTDAEEAS